MVVEVSDTHCEGTTSGSAVVEKYPIPETPVITQEGDELFSNITIGNQWYLDDNTISGATEATYWATVDGKYYDILTMNTCNSDTSNIINVVIIGIPENNTDAFQIIPNPAKDKIKIIPNNLSQGELSIKVFSLSGMFIHEYKLRPGFGNSSQTIDISELNAGLYLLQISNSKTNFVYKLIVQ